MKYARAGGVLVLAASTVGASYLAMRSPTLEERERALAVRVRRPRGPFVDRIMSAATDLGSMFAVAGTAGVLATSHRAQSAVDVAGGGMLAWSASQGLKPLVRRPRPYQLEKAERLVAEPSGSSWPSAHPAVAAAVASVLAPRLSPSGRTVGTLLAVFVAASRVYVGVHYPTDVVAGLGIGGFCGVVWRPAATRLYRAAALLWSGRPEERLGAGALVGYPGPRRVWQDATEVGGPDLGSETGGAVLGVRARD